MIPVYFSKKIKFLFSILPILILALLAILFYHKLCLKLPHDIVFTTNYIYLAGILTIIGGQFIRFSIYYMKHVKKEIPIKINSKYDLPFKLIDPQTKFEILKQNLVIFFSSLAADIRLNYNNLWQNFFVTFIDQFNLNFFMYSILRFFKNQPILPLHYTLYIGLYLLPKAIVLLALMVDVFIFQRIEYFYFCAPLILVERFYNNLYDFLLWFLQGHYGSLEDNLQRQPGKFVDSQGYIIDYAFHIEDDIVYEDNRIVTFHPEYKKPHFIKNLRDYYENYIIPMRKLLLFHGGMLGTATLLKRKETDLIFAYLYLGTWITVLSLMLNYKLINGLLLLN